MLFSIIIPTYNYAHYLPQALEAVLAQTFSDYELIVVDDGSTDNTADVLAQYPSHFKGKLRCFTQANAGPGAARMRGIHASRGQYIIMVDADDVLLADALMHFSQALRQPGGADVVVAIKGRLPNRVSRATSNTAYVKAYIRKQLTLCNGTMAIAKSLLTRITFPTQLSLCEDIPVFVHILATARNPHFISQHVIHIRKHADSRRHDVDALLQSLQSLPDLVFDRAIMTDYDPRLKNEFIARLHLRAFRLLCQHRRYAEARQHYHLAIRRYPRVLWLFTYFKKYIKSWIGAVTPNKTLS